MAAFEVLALDTATPQIRAPGAGDTYTFPRAITPSGANVTPFTVSGYSLTGANAQSMFDLSGTWNTSGTPTALKLNITDTASNAASLLMDLQVGGSTRFNVRKDGTVNLSTNAPYINVPSGFAALQFSGANVLVWQSGAVRVNGADLQIGSTDTILTRDAANTLAQRNGVNPQTFRVYRTFTDASNYERLSISSDAISHKIVGERAGTGTNRNLYLEGGGNALGLGFAPSGAVNWTISSGHILAGTDNVHDIGQSGANRPRDLFLGGNITLGGSSITSAAGGTWSQPSVIEFAAGGHLRWAGRSKIYSEADGNFSLYNNATTDFGRLQFGGTTASFPALKRNTTFLETKLADDSAYAPHAMQYLDITDGITAPASASGRARIYVDTADGDLKVVFGDGTVKTIVVDT